MCGTTYEPTIDLVTGSCSFRVDFEETFEQMLAANKGKLIDSRITAQRFQINENGTIVINAKLFHFGRYECARYILTEFDKYGYRAANIAELLAFGRVFPNKILRLFPIVALGSISQDNFREVVYLSVHYRGTNMWQHLKYLDWEIGIDLWPFETTFHGYASVFPEHCRFLAVLR